MRASRREVTLHDIIDAAARLFSKKGFSATTIRDVAAEVGRTQGSLYYHVRSKEDIFIKMYEMVLEEFMEHVEEAMQGSDTSTETIRSFIRAALQYTAMNQDYTTILLDEFKSLPEEHKEMVSARRDKLDRIIDETLAAGMQDGEFRQVDIRLTRLALWGMINYVNKWYSPSGPLGIEDIADHFADIFVGGVGNREN